MCIKYLFTRAQIQHTIAKQKQKTIFNILLFLTEVLNPLHEHLLSYMQTEYKCCEHARFCVEVFFNALYINFYSFITSKRKMKNKSVDLIWNTPILTHYSLKPVLKWANVCSLNILQPLRWTMIRFLIELLVQRIWFGQSKLYFILNWLVMRCKLWPELAADVQQTAWLKM